MKRILLLLLSLCMMLSVSFGLMSCNKDKGGEQTTEASDTQQNNVSDNALYQDLKKVDYSTDGVPKTFTIYSNTCTAGLMDSDSTSTDLERAVYKRNAFVEAELGIEIVWEQALYDEMVPHIRTLQASDAYAYDIVYNEARFQSQLVLEDAYKSTEDYAQFIDFEKPWWYQDVIGDMTIADNCYLIAGDMNMQLNDMIWAVTYNNTILNDNGVGSIYDMIANNEWTFEKMYSLSKETLSEGRFGIVSHYQFVDALMIGAGLSLTEKNEDGELLIATFGDRFVTVYQDMVQKFFTQNGMDGENRIIFQGNTEINKNNNGFAGVKSHETYVAGSATFYVGVTGDLRVYLPSVSFDYGIAPIPKYESTQSNYISWVSAPAPLCGVMANIDLQGEEQTAFVANVMEWLSAYSYEWLRPAYYDTVLYGRISKDPQAMESLKIIFGVDERGTKKIEYDSMFWLGMTAVLEASAGDCVMDIQGQLSTVSGKAETAITAVHEHYKAS